MRQAFQHRPAGATGTATVVALALPAAPALVETGFLNLGRFRAPGLSLVVNSRYLELDGQPLTALFLFTQKWLVSGLTSGAVKG